ncbi:hypothetical protein [Rhizobium arsenicireducens]
MILETTNPKYAQRAQFCGTRIHYERVEPQEYDGLGGGQWSREVAKSADFRERHPIHEPEPELPVVSIGSSIWVADEKPDAPLWFVIDRVTGVTFARVRGSLPWIVSQVRLVATQLGGSAADLYYRKAPIHDYA